MAELRNLSDELLIQLVRSMELIFHIEVLMDLIIKLPLELRLFGKFDVEILSQHVDFILKLLDLVSESQIHLL